MSHVRRILLAVLLSATAAPAHAGNADKAIRSIEREKYERAEVLLVEARERFPDDPEVALAMSVLYAISWSGRDYIVAFDQALMAIALAESRDQPAVAARAKAQIQSFWRPSDTIVFEEVKKRNTLEAYTGYLNHYQRGAHVDEAYRLKEDLLAAEALADGTLGAYEAFLSSGRWERYHRRDEVLSVYTEKLWDRVRQEGSVQALSEFVTEFPDSGAAGDGRQMIYDMVAGSARDEAAAAAYLRLVEGRQEVLSTPGLIRAATETLYRDYSLDRESEVEALYIRYSDLSLAEDLRERLSGWEFERAEARNTVSSYEAFLEAYPESSHAARARASLKQLKESIAAAEAEVQEQAKMRYLRRQTAGWRNELSGCDVFGWGKVHTALFDSSRSNLNVDVRNRRSYVVNITAHIYMYESEEDWQNGRWYTDTEAICAGCQGSVTFSVTTGFNHYEPEGIYFTCN